MSIPNFPAALPELGGDLPGDSDERFARMLAMQEELSANQAAIRSVDSEQAQSRPSWNWSAPYDGPDGDSARAIYSGPADGGVVLPDRAPSRRTGTIDVRGGSGGLGAIMRASLGEAKQSIASVEARSSAVASGG